MYSKDNEVFAKVADKLEIDRDAFLEKCSIIGLTIISAFEDGYKSVQIDKEEIELSLSRKLGRK